MLAAQLAHPPATNHTMADLPRSDAIVTCLPPSVVNVPSGASGAELAELCVPAPPPGPRCPSPPPPPVGGRAVACRPGHASFPASDSSCGIVAAGEPLT